MLSVKNLIKEFNGLTAVNNISFQVDEGKIFGLLGPNGAGKTTTIRTILNIIKPTQGEILFDNKKISNDFFNIIGYLPEERGLYKKSKVIDVIRYFGELKNMSVEAVQKESKHWLEKLEMTNYVNKKVEELSKGNQQKIQFITSVIHNPKLLILDEPFSGLDPINQQMIKEKILDFVTSGKIIILCTHQMETAEKLCSEIFLINSGEEVLSGSISKIKKQFGGNNVKLEYDGDASFISNLPFVIHADIYNNYAEVQLKDSFKPSEFLKAVIDKVSVSQFSVIEPTLNKIFIDSISKSAGN